MGTLTQVLKDIEFGVASEPQSHTSWESGYLGLVNMITRFPKYEANHGEEMTKRRGHIDSKDESSWKGAHIILGAPKRLGRVSIRSATKV
jgi:hypothetical protein